MEIRFRKKTKYEWLALFVLVMPFLFALLTELLPGPDIIKYTVDIAWVALLAGMINRKRHYLTAPVKKLFVVVGLFLFVSLVGFLLNFQSVFYYLWGIRNNIRFYVYFFACILFIRTESVDSYLSFFDKVFWLNALIMTFQYLVFDIKQDFLGGIFGTSRGCNSYTNILFIIVTTKSLLYCLNNKETLSKCMLKCGVAVLLAAISELKAFYVELIVIVALVMWFSKLSFKKVGVFFGIAVGIVVGIELVGVIFPDFENWFSIKRIWESATNTKGYTSSNDINRLTAVSIATERFLTQIHQKLFGLGLGNCDYAGFDFLISPFYKAYGGLNYVWFSSAMILLETGFVGMAIYTFFFVQLFFSIRTLYKGGAGNRLHCQMGMICAVMCIFLFVLNSSLRIEAAFMMYFVLALPFVSCRSSERENAELSDSNQ